MAHAASTPCDEAVILQAEGSPCSRAAARWVLAVTILGSSVAFIDAMAVNVALPVLQKDLGASVSGAQWIVEAYSLFLSSLVMVGGSLGDRLGRRRIFIAGTLVFAAASLACGLAPDIRTIVAARAVQGIGAALLVPTSLAILGAAFPPDERGRAVGTWSALTSVSAALGPALGGWLVQAVSWRAVFLLNLPIAAAVVAIALLRVPESRNPSAGRLDVTGTALVTIGLGALIYGLIEAPTSGWSQLRTWAPIAIGAAALAAFVAVERRTQYPIVPLALFEIRTFAAANLLTLFFYTALTGLFFFFPFELIQARGYSPTAAGVASLPLVAITSSLSRRAGSLADRYGPRPFLIVGPAVAGLGFALFAVLPAAGSYAVSILPALGVLGLGMGITVAPLTAAVLNAVGRDDTGTASGINNAVARVAGLLAIAIFGIVAAGTFNRTLDRRLDAAKVSPQTRRVVEPERARLGAMKAPRGVPAEEASAIEEAVPASLDAAFREVAWICTALALLAAGCAAWGVSPKRSG
jgi:EmrB/QacA subfamily drug resistance transporter